MRVWGLLSYLHDVLSFFGGDGGGELLFCTVSVSRGSIFFVCNLVTKHYLPVC